MEFLRNFPRQYLNTDSFHLHLCPYSKGEEKAARQWIIPSYDQLAGFSIHIQLMLTQTLPPEPTHVRSSSAVNQRLDQHILPSV